MQKTRGRSMVSINLRTYRGISTILLIFFLVLVSILAIQLILYLIAVLLKLALIIFAIAFVIMGAARLLNKYTGLVSITCPHCDAIMDETPQSETANDKGSTRWRCDRCKKTYREKLFGGWRVVEDPDKRVVS